MGTKNAGSTDAGESVLRLVRSLALAVALVLPTLGLLAAPAASAADQLGLSGFAAPISASPAAAPALAALHAAVRAEKARVRGVSLTPSALEPHWGCPEGTCDELVDPKPRAERRNGRLRYFPSAEAGTGAYEGGGVSGGFDPQDLQSAYKIPTAGGEDETVAVVDAYGYSTAEADLATYRRKYGLPPCTKADGCFHKINQRGEEGGYPPDEDGWDGEAALDLDMVSAACPYCHIMLAEGESDYDESLSETVDAAVGDGATEVSNSYGSTEGGSAEEQASYRHAGVLITVSAGDYGYDDHELGKHAPQYPAVLPSVVSVGGTVLTKAPNARGWEDKVWPGSGSGCSSLAKPVWQHDSGCSRRMDNDVAAVASCNSPVSVYDSLGSGWEDVCGTSASSPLVAGIEAHATPYARSLPGADAFYSDPGAFFDVSAGSNGSCTPQQDAYFCTAEEGYDGPTGNGVPDGGIELGTAAPLVSTSSAISFSGAGVTFNGEVDPQGGETSYRFEYGKSTAYGTSVPVPEGTLPASTASSAVSATASGLEAGATYHVRLTATNSSGTSHGQDVTFATAPPSVSSISPDAGPPDGGTEVTIDGADFEDATAVEFGSAPARDFEVISPEEIQAVSSTGTGTTHVTVTTPAGSSEVGAASSFTYQASGPVLAWGSKGENLGDGQSTASDVPVEVSGLPEVVQLAAGGHQGLALESDGRVLGWGDNSGDEVGDGTAGSKSTPVPVCAAQATEACPTGPYLEGVKAIAAGATHSLALLEDGRVLSWGRGIDGQLGRGPYFQFSRTPAFVCARGSFATPKGACDSGDYLEEVVAIAAAGNFSLALRRNGTVLAWGEDNEGQLGTGTTKGLEKCEGAEETTEEEHLKVPCSGSPLEVAGLSEVTALAAGGSQAAGTLGKLRLLGGGHGLALLHDGTVMAWGQNLDGELGDGAVNASSSPVPVCAAAETAPCARKLSDVTAVAAGEGTSVALVAGGAVLTWGQDENLDEGSNPHGPEVCGEIGETFHETCASTPLPSLLSHDVRAIASGGGMGMAVTTAGEVLTWGFGTMGDGAPNQLAWSPTAVCTAFASGPCPEGPFLEGSVAAMAVGLNDAFLGMHVEHASITAVSPSGGPAAGGAAVTIVGSGLAETTAVSFGSTPAASFEVLSDTEIAATAPAGAGVLDVSVSGPSGTSASTRADRFTYETPPVVSSERATDVRLGSAQLEGELEDGDGTTSGCHFEYGLGEAYGHSVACGEGPEHAAEVDGLKPGTTYHFRLAAADAFGMGQGPDATLTTPPTELPEVGRCAKLATPTGRYAAKTCTTASSGGDSGSYEWLQGPGGATGFTAAGTGMSFLELGEGGGAVVIECAGSSAAGTYTGPQSADLQLTLTGCEGTGALYTGVPAESCHSEDAPAGEITSTPLSLQLGLFTAKRKPEAGWGLEPSSGSDLASFTCGTSQEMTLLGGVIGEIEKPDRQATEFTVAFTTTKAHGKKPLVVQIPEGWPNALRDPLQIHAEDFGYTGLALDGTVTVTQAEALEVKALP